MRRSGNSLVRMLDLLEMVARNEWTLESKARLAGQLSRPFDITLKCGCLRNAWELYCFGKLPHG